MTEVCVRELAKSVAQPWLYSACIPDGSKYLTPFTIRQTGNIGPGTGGSCAGVFAGLQPDAFTVVDTGNTTAVAIVPTNWTTATQITTLGAQYTKYRVVSASLKVWYTGSSLNDQGTLIMGQLSSEVHPIDFNGSALTAFAANSSYNHVGSFRQGGTIAWRPEDFESMALLYTVDISADTTSADLNVPYLYAYAYGCAATATFQYEITVNYEGYSKNQTYIPGGLNRVESVAAPGWYEKVSNMVKDIPAYVGIGAQTMSAINDVSQAIGAVRGRPQNVRRMMGAITL